MDAFTRWPHHHPGDPRSRHRRARPTGRRACVTATSKATADRRPPRAASADTGCGVTYLDALRSAFEALRANPTRSILTTLGIIIGVAAVIIVVAIGPAPRTGRVPDQEPGLEPPDRGAGDRHLRRECAYSRRRALTEDDVASLPARCRACNCRYRSSSRVPAGRAGSNWPSTLYGVGPGFLQARDWR